MRSGGHPDGQGAHRQSDYREEIMVAADPRNPGTDGLTRLWVLPVPILGDELISSWLARSALTLGCDPLVLTGAIWPHWRVWTVDVDRAFPEDRLEALIRACGIARARICKAGLEDVHQAISCHIDQGIWPWLLAYGTRNRRHRGGLQYCPRCLGGNHIPYYRRAWRLAWHTGCAIHGETLRDGCPCCSAAIEPHLLTAQAIRLDRCASCGGDLRQAGRGPLQRGAFRFQQLADEVVEVGCGRFGDQTMPSREWFALARFLIALLRRVSSGKSRGLRHFLTSLDVDPSDVDLPPVLQLPLELLSTGERIQLLRPIAGLLEAGVDRFITAARGARLTQASLHSVQPNVPIGLGPLVKSLPCSNYCRRHNSARRPEFPRTPSAVLRQCRLMHRRLARR
ncbi:TniQ family protein [Labrys sedimenti]|uniref:TniQ family protein n=1 Tax=Labrys sedimenti TaxID=3106036 RepID=UPI003CD05906